MEDDEKNQEQETGEPGDPTDAAAEQVLAPPAEDDGSEKPAAKSLFHRVVVGEISVKRVLRSAFLIYGFFFLFALFFSEHLIFKPRPSSYRDNEDVIKLTSADGAMISSVHLPNPDARYTLLFSHGNAEDIGHARPTLMALRDLGFGVFAYDYHGYGTSEGKPSERTAYMDIDAAYDHMTGPLGIAPQRIFAFGRSLGGAMALDLASRRPVAGLILQSAFLTAFRVLTRVPLLPFDKFRNGDKIEGLKCPVLVMHGTEDKVVPFWHGQRLFELASQPKHHVWLDGLGHNNIWVENVRYRQALEDFLSLVKRHETGSERVPVPSVSSP